MQALSPCLRSSCQATQGIRVSKYIPHHSVKLAKVDADQHPKAAEEFGVAGYPTLFFFINGTKIDYTGGRETDQIVDWLNRKLLPPITDISTQEEYDALAGQSTVSIVLFPGEEKHIATIHNLAVVDDHNRYYRAVGDLLNTQPAGTVKLIRDFDEEATFTGEFIKVRKWIERQARPLLLPFDDRTVQTIFGATVKAVLLFDAGELDSASLRRAVTEAAKGYEGDLVFAVATVSYV